MDTHGFERVDEEEEDHGFEKVAVAPHGFEKVAPTTLLSKEGMKSAVNTVIPNIKQGFRGVDLYKMENPDPTQGIIKTPYADTPEQKREKLSNLQMEMQAGQKEIQGLQPANPSFPLQIVSGATQSIAQNLPGIAGAVAAKNLSPAVPLMGMPTIAKAGANVLPNSILPAVTLSVGQTKGQIYAKDRTPDAQGNTKVSIDNARKNADTQAALEGTLGIAPVAGLLKDMGKETFMKTVGKFILREEMTEIPTTAWQKISDTIYTNPNQPFKEFIKEMGSDVLDTALIAPLAAGGTASLAGAQTAAQLKVATLLNRKEQDKSAALDKTKADLMTDLQKRVEAAQAGLDENALVQTDISVAPSKTAPLTPEEDKLADIQLKNMKSGATDTPVNPVAQADTADFDKILTDHNNYKTADDIRHKTEDLIQQDMDKGMSRAVAERRASEVYPNLLPPTQRPIAWSTNPAHVGLNLQQAAIGANDVVVLQGNEEHFSPAYTKALGETLSEWSKKFMPEGSRIVLNLTGLKGLTTGAHQMSASGIHIISPREIKKPSRGENSKPETWLGDKPITGYNPFTQQQTFGAITHEFGHAMVMGAFAQNMPKPFRNVVGALDSGKVYQEAELASMPAPEAAVIREYQAMKLSVLNGTMTAEELVEKWLGTWKVGADLSKQQGRELYSWAKKVLLDEAKFKGDSRLSSLPLNQIPAIELVHAMGRDTREGVTPEMSDAAAEAYYLMFNEYMAEQFSRYAHVNKIDEGTALGVYFKKALDSLRALFKQLKSTKGVDGETIIKSGVSFQSWVDGMVEAKALAIAKREAKRTKPKSTRKPRALKPKVVPDIEDLPEIVAARQKEKEEAAGEGNTTNILEELAEDPMIKELLKERVKKMFPDIKDDTRAEMMQMIRRGELLEVEDQLADIAESRLKKDVKEAGGNWDPYAVDMLMESSAFRGTPEVRTWLRKSLARYMNKFIGTKNDPLKDIPVPYEGEFHLWEDITDSIVRSWKLDAETKAHYRDEGLMDWTENIAAGIPIWNIDGASAHPNSMAYLFAAQDWIAHVVDYMSNHVDPSKYQQYDFVRAGREVAIQDAKQRKKMETTEGQLEGTTIVKQYPDGFQWVKVESAGALRNEGDSMGHCVGGYCEAVQNGDTEIYSLRDPQGRPHVTIEVKPEEGTPNDPDADPMDQQTWFQEPGIRQIKGKQNLAPAKEYHPYVHDFVLGKKWSYTSDLAGVRLGRVEDFAVTSSTSRNARWIRYAADAGLEFGQIYPSEKLLAVWAPYSQRPNSEEENAEDYANDERGHPFLDKDSGDAQEVEKTLNRLGIKETKIWKKAVDFTKNLEYYVLQIQQLAHTSSDMGLNMFNSYQNMLMAMKNNMLKWGTEIADQWENLGPADSALVEKILLDEFHSGGHMTELTEDANGKWSHIGGIGFIDYAKQRGLDVTTPNGQVLGKLILDIKNSMLEHIGIIEKMAIEIAQDKYSKSELMQRRREHEIRAVADKWRKVPFVPQGHYGDYVVKVFERDENKKRVLVYQGHFESAAEQDIAVKNFQKTVEPENLRWMKIKDKTGPQLILPKDFLQSLEDTGEFTSDQLAEIGDAMTPLRDEKAFSKFARDASKIAGASPDMLKNYANWIEDSANAVSKMKYGRRMTNARAFTRSEMVDLKHAGDIEGARVKQRMLDTMEKAQQFILHPMEEYHRVRSIVSLTFLMYSVKTALMNATGLFQTVAAVTADYGDIAGGKILAGSIKSLMSSKFSKDEHHIRERALADGIIDQGFGYFMSGLANAGNLQRRIRPTLAGKAARLFVDTGMYLFKAVETGNRQVTLLSIYRAERTRYLGMKEEDGSPLYTLAEASNLAYMQAANKTRLLQNDYASGNRPEALRGKKSLLMIFLSYPQYMLWIMSGGYERGTRAEQRNRGQTPRSVLGGTTMRMWLIFLALAGIEGVPFGETILELVQRMWKLFGKGENIRVEGQRFLKDAMGIESRYWRTVIQRGFLHDVLGADLSGSYSLGKPLPGLGMINPQADNWKEYAGEFFAELSGPFGGVVKGGLELGLSDDIGMKELGKSLPGAAGAIARAVSASEQGVKSSRGERILRDENGNLREPSALEIAAIGAGFRLTEVAKFQEVERLKRQSADYWNGRRLGLKKAYKRAVDERNPEAREDVLKSVVEYNDEIPDRGLRLSGKEMREYVRTTSKAVRRLEQDRDPARVRGLHRDISKVFSEPP